MTHPHDNSFHDPPSGFQSDSCPGASPGDPPLPCSPPPGTPPLGNQPPDANPDLENKDPNSKDEGSNTPYNWGIGTGNLDLLNAQDITVHLDSLKDTLAALREIRNASLDTQLEEDDLTHLRNPTEEELDINDPYFQLSLDMYIILTNVSQETYHDLLTAFLWCHPEAKGRLLLYDQVKCRIKNLTRIIPLHDDLCINSHWG